MIESIIYTWALSTLISLLWMSIGIIRCIIQFNLFAKVTDKDNKFLGKTLLIAFVPVWNLFRTISFAYDPSAYIHG